MLMLLNFEAWDHVVTMHPIGMSKTERYHGRLAQLSDGLLQGI